MKTVMWMLAKEANEIICLHLPAMLVDTMVLRFWYSGWSEIKFDFGCSVILLSFLFHGLDFSLRYEDFLLLSCFSNLPFILIQSTNNVTNFIVQFISKHEGALCANVSKVTVFFCLFEKYKILRILKFKIKIHCASIKVSSSHLYTVARGYLPDSRCREIQN